MTAPPPTLQSSAGIGFRAPHVADFVDTRPAVGWLEVHAENYMGGGRALSQLEMVRRDWPVALHGVGMSLGSPGGLDPVHLDRLARLADRLDPVLVSEHLSWSAAGGVHLNDLLPLPYTEETLEIFSDNVARLQDRLRRRVLIENPSVYLAYRHATLEEAAFLAELVRRTGCGLVCDVNNIHVSCANVGGDPYRWLDTLPSAAVDEIHLAGHRANDVDGTIVLIDDHGSPVVEAVWRLFAHAVRRFPTAAPLIEWDTDLPSLAVLVDQAAEADRRRAAALAEAGHAFAA